MQTSETIRSIGRIARLDREQERDLAIRAAGGDIDARAALVRSCLPSVIAIAKGYRAWSTPLDDLVQYGCVGLMKAVAKFDPDRGTRLSTYAGFWIRAEIRAGVVGEHRSVRLGATATERRAIRAYRTRPIASPEELAEVSGMPLARSRALWPLLQQSDVPLDDRTRTGAVRKDLLADDTTPTPEEALISLERARRVRSTLPRVVGRFSEREQRIVRRRLLCDEPASLRELGEDLGLSRERVRQIEIACRNKLRIALSAAA